MLVVCILLFVGRTSISQSHGSGSDTGQCTSRTVPQFIDVTARSGIRFQHTSDPVKKYIPESMGGGVLLLDFDRDGWLDIYFTNAPTVAMTKKGIAARSALYRNNHDGTFTDVTDKAGVAFPCAAMGGAVGDFDNDGWPDMYITCLGGNVLYRNNGDGTFTDVAWRAGVREGRWSTGAAFADYDQDGYLDLMVANYVDLDLQHLAEPGSASTCTYRGAAVQCGPHGMKGSGDSLFHNKGDGTFAEVSEQMGVSDRAGYYGLGVLWADFDGSGHPSLFVANDSTPNYLYRNQGHGPFSETGLPAGVAFNADGKEQANMGVTAGDYLHNGRQSLFVTTFSDEEKPLYLNEGNWAFKEVAAESGLGTASLPLLGWGTAFADLDNDGWLDLITVYGHVYPQVDSLPASAGFFQPKTLYLNQQHGSFCDASAFAGQAFSSKSSARGLAVGDLFNDGRLDAVIENLDGAPMVLRNQGVPGTHWIEFELVGTTSNRSAIGAELTLRAGGMVQSQEIRSGGSYLSQSDMRAHFGLAAALSADQLVVRWPSGQIDTLNQLAGDRIYSVLEGSGVVDRIRLAPAAIKLKHNRPPTFSQGAPHAASGTPPTAAGIAAHPHAGDTQKQDDSGTALPQARQQ
jgi:hypothetical protein